MSVSDYDSNDVKDNEWIYARLAEQKRKEIPNNLRTTNAN
jgi:hypothetical protein